MFSIVIKRKQISGNFILIFAVLLEQNGTEIMHNCFGYVQKHGHFFFKVQNITRNRGDL